MNYYEKAELLTLAAATKLQGEELLLWVVKYISEKHEDELEIARQESYDEGHEDGYKAGYSDAEGLYA